VRKETRGKRKETNVKEVLEKKALETDLEQKWKVAVPCSVSVLEP
jgi:hypothetical protein